jgi:hypothetical protein
MMTKDEFDKSLVADFSAAVEATYQDLIKAAVTAERDALEAELLKLKLAYVYAQRIDWLLSCDDGEDSFHKRLQAQLKELT